MNSIHSFASIPIFPFTTFRKHFQTALETNARNSLPSPGLTAVIPFADGKYHLIKGPDTCLLVSNKPEPPRPIMLFVSARFSQINFEMKFR